MGEKMYFFRPRVGKNYAGGFQGLKTLVVGVCHICSLPCTFHDRCSDPEKVRTMDGECPCYTEKEDQEYYRLSNSNEIEIRSFIDGEAHYPAYKIFTYYLLRSAGDLTSAQREEVWESLAFTNLLQFFHDSSDVLPPGESGVYDAAFPQLLQVVEELRPQVILAWDERVRDCLKQHRQELKYVGKADMQFGLSLYIFVPRESDLSGRKMSRLRYRFGVQTEVHRLGWYKSLLRHHLIKYIEASEQDSEQIIRNLANNLMDMVDDGLLAASETNLYFPETDTYKWTSLLKGLFLRVLKDEYPQLGRGANGGVEQIFQEELATNKRDEKWLKKDELRIVCHLQRYFKKCTGAGKTFSKKYDGKR